MSEWDDYHQELWAVFNWRVRREHNGCHDRAAADILCTLLEHVVDANRALRGAKTGLPSPPDSSPAALDRWKEAIADMVVPMREMLLMILDDEDGTVLRMLLQETDKHMPQATEDDDLEEEDDSDAEFNYRTKGRPNFVEYLVGLGVCGYCHRRWVEEEREAEADVEDLRRLLDEDEEDED